MTYDEVEFKYNAKKIELSKFKELMEGFNPSQYIEVSGKDTFYINPSDPSIFCRHRVNNDTPELTFKKKTTDSNSYIRTEINVPLSTTADSSTLTKFLEVHGYTKGKTIYKTSFIYVCDNHITAYYICYSEDMKELGRFLEIEIREDKDLGTVEERFNLLKALEKLMEPLGLTPKKRVASSLFEMFGK